MGSGGKASHEEKVKTGLIFDFLNGEGQQMSPKLVKVWDTERLPGSNSAL